MLSWFLQTCNIHKSKGHGYWALLKNSNIFKQDNLYFGLRFGLANAINDY